MTQAWPLVPEENSMHVLFPLQIKIYLYLSLSVTLLLLLAYYFSIFIFFVTCYFIAGKGLRARTASTLAKLVQLGLKAKTAAAALTKTSPKPPSLYCLPGGALYEIPAGLLLEVIRNPLKKMAGPHSTKAYLSLTLVITLPANLNLISVHTSFSI